MITINFDKMGGLIPAIIQDHESGEVLMVAFMDQKTLEYTLRDGKTWFFSRTRNKYWMKGEESGNTQDVVEILTDCDQEEIKVGMPVEMSFRKKYTEHGRGIYSYFWKAIPVREGD